MKQKDYKKRALFLRAQKGVINFANGFQTRFQITIILQPLPNLRHGFGANAELLGNPAGIPDGEDPDEVSLTAVTLGTALLMPNGAM
jgi:hypothetical protein